MCPREDRTVSHSGRPSKQDATRPLPVPASPRQTIRRMMFFPVLAPIPTRCPYLAAWPGCVGWSDPEPSFYFSLFFCRRAWSWCRPCVHCGLWRCPAPRPRGLPGARPVPGHAAAPDPCGVLPFRVRNHFIAGGCERYSAMKSPGPGLCGQRFAWVRPLALVSCDQGDHFALFFFS